MRFICLAGLIISTIATTQQLWDRAIWTVIVSIGMLLWIELHDIRKALEGRSKDR